jgi:hypothetical protein
MNLNRIEQEWLKQPAAVAKRDDCHRFATIPPAAHDGVATYHSDHFSITPRIEA